MLTGFIVASACARIDNDALAFRCNPRDDVNCPGGFLCCSDDPAAEGGGLPRLNTSHGMIVGSTPFFAGNNNPLGTSGMCIKPEDVDSQLRMAEAIVLGCPIPCNPHWNPDDIAAVCGVSARCCQTVELGPKDCVRDPETNRWRPVAGADIGTLTDWRSSGHSTAQDASPPGAGCSTFARSNGGPVWADCVSNLSVADQRGFCTPSDEDCPLADVDYLDHCECLNDPPPDDPKCASH